MLWFCYEPTTAARTAVRNSGEDGMDRYFIEKQSIKTFGLSNKEFEHNYRVDDRSLELQAKLDEEYGRLVDDRKILREFVFPRVLTTQPHYLPVNMYRILQNAIQIFHIDRRKPSELEPV
jgi:DNA-directed RNA polymerase II subunit RPB1